jgi:glutamate 5-kinase
MTDHLSLARRIIVKVGSRLLVNSATGALNSEWLTSLVADLAALPRIQDEADGP